MVVALLFVFGLPPLDISDKSTGGPATPPVPLPAPFIIEAVTFDKWMAQGTVVAVGPGYGQRSSPKTTGRAHF